MTDIAKACGELNVKLRDAFPTLNIFCDPSKNDGNVWFEVMLTKTVGQHDMVTSFLIAVREGYSLTGDPSIFVYCLYLTKPTTDGPDDMFLDQDKLMVRVTGLVPHD